MGSRTLTRAQSRSRSSTLLVVTLGAWATICAIAVYNFRLAIPPGLTGLQTLALFSVQVPWALVWLWALHGVSHQAAAVLMRQNHWPSTKSQLDEGVAILYATCD